MKRVQKIAKRIASSGKERVARENMTVPEALAKVEEKHQREFDSLGRKHQYIVDEQGNKMEPDEELFWKGMYIVWLSAIGGGLLVNADNEQDALDSAIDHAEEQGWEGLFLQDDDIEEIREEHGEEGLDDYTSGGNHGRYLNDFNVNLKLLFRTR